MNEFPDYDDTVLVASSPAELIDLIVANEDRVQRNVIDECARRGDAMLEALAPWVNPDRQQEIMHPGRWWLRLHAIMILGLMPGERAGMLLVEFIRSMCTEEDQNLQEWFAGYWPALTHNKPVALVQSLRDISTDRKIHWFMRINILEAVIAVAQREGEAKLETALDWTAQFAADETEDWDMRLLAANNLIDFPRERHRAMLEKLAAIQSRIGRHFDTDDIDNAFAHGTDRPDWNRFDNPWQFYEPKAILARQKRWREEDARGAAGHNYRDKPDYFIAEPHRRETAKISRNDPCPCGNGKKYKKCCMGKDVH